MRQRKFCCIPGMAFQAGVSSYSIISKRRQKCYKSRYKSVTKSVTKAADFRYILLAGVFPADFSLKTRKCNEKP